MIGTVEEVLDDPNAGQRLRLGVLDVIDGGLGVALGRGDNAIGHVLGRQTGVIPDAADDRNVDRREDVGRGAHDGERAQQHYNHRQHDERVGSLQRKSYDPHRLGVPILRLRYINVRLARGA